LKTLLIVNPKAGRRKVSPVEEITAALRQPFVDLSVHLTTGPGDATVAARQAAKDGFELVVAAGGDGSLNEVANGLVGSDVELGLVPVGTENVLARELGIPLNANNACRHLLDKVPRRIDVGRIADRYFVCFAGIGFDAHVAHNLSPQRKASLGSAAYFLTSFERIGPYRKSPRMATLKVDGHEITSSFWMMLVGNIQNYGGGLKPAPQARMDDGLLDLCVYPVAGYPATVRQMVSTRSGRHLNLPGMLYRQAKRIEIVTDPVEQVQLDGDPWAGTTPLTVEVEPGSLSVRF
jgi:YegS/Rv2252/BmrU family lipid kinase